MTTYETKDTGTHLEYDSGMRRDSQDGKPRFDLIRTRLQPYEEQMIYRYAMLLARGAEKYDARNWEEGCGEEELDRAKASLLRHAEQLIAGERDEDHAAAVWFNTQAIEYFRWRLGYDEVTGPTDAERAESARRASEINRLALEKATEIRRRQRLREAAQEGSVEASNLSATGVFQSVLGDSGFAEPAAGLSLEAQNVAVADLAKIYGGPVYKIETTQGVFYTLASDQEEPTEPGLDQLPLFD